MKWNGAGTIWINLETDNPSKINEAYLKYLGLLQNKLKYTKPLSIEYELIEEYFAYIIVIPTIRGKALSTSAWVMESALSILTAKPVSENLLVFITTEIPVDLFESLQINLCQSTEIQNANSLAGITSLLFLIFSSLSQLKMLPQLSDAGIERLRKFLADRSLEISELLQRLIDLRSGFIKIVNSLTPKEKNNRVNLLKAIVHLENIIHKAFPDGKLTDSQTINVEQFEEYARNLANLQEEFQEIRSDLIIDFLENGESNS